MSLIGKLYGYIQKNPQKKKHGIDPVVAHKDKVYPRFTTFLPWSFYIKRNRYLDSETIIETCIIVHKNGSLQTVYGFRGVDIDSHSDNFVAVIYQYFNAQIMRLGDGWMVSAEDQRFKMHEYPYADFDNVAALLVDRERGENFRDSGDHYDSSYYLNFVYKPENEIKKKISNKFYKENTDTKQIEREIAYFEKTVESLTAVLSGRLVIRPLDCQETVEYLHSTVSMSRHYFRLPEGRSFLFLDRLISDEMLEVGKTLRLGEYYIPIVEIDDFPSRTYPAILNELNKMEMEYRWVSRYFPLSKAMALKELKDYQRNAAASKSSAKDIGAEFALGIKNNLEDHSGVHAQNEAESAQEEIGGDFNGGGYYNSCIMVWDKDYRIALSKAAEVKKVIEQCQFSCHEEEIGAFDAFLGMCAGNTTSDVRRPFVTSGNFSQTLPFSAIWAGMEYNRHTNEVCGCDKPLITCATDYGQNFYFNTNDGDLGHALILGPSGGGKSTFLDLIEISALKYPGVQVFIMDYGLSALTLTLAVGGTYINPADSTVCFQPLCDIDTSEEFSWAVEFILTILEIQGIETIAEVKVAVNSAMKAVRELPKEYRTLTSLCMNLEYTDREGRKILHDALHQYLKGGRYGDIFDGEENTLKGSRWVLFEMEKIMKLGHDCSAPALLLIFHFLEKNFNGNLTYFIMDECWFGLQNPAICSKMSEYLLTLRKKNVFCIFATQNPSMVANSDLGSVIIQNCPTHVFLADPTAAEEVMKNDYAKLGLKTEEIMLLAGSKKKRDYYVKCPSGTRKFQLALGPIELALFRGRETAIKLEGHGIVKWEYIQKFLLKERIQKDGRIRCMVDKILDLQNVEYKRYLEDVEWKDWL